MACFRRFGVTEARRSETISREKCYLYRSTRPRLVQSLTKFNDIAEIELC